MATTNTSLAARLKKEIHGDVLFDAATRGRYSTDASIYQIEPIGVVVPRTDEAARIALQIAAEEGVPILPRGAGSSQCGQRTATSPAMIVVWQIEQLLPAVWPSAGSEGGSALVSGVLGFSAI